MTRLFFSEFPILELNYKLTVILATYDLDSGQHCFDLQNDKLERIQACNIHCERKAAFCRFVFNLLQTVMGKSGARMQQSLCLGYLGKRKKPDPLLLIDFCKSKVFIWQLCLKARYVGFNHMKAPPVPSVYLNIQWPSDLWSVLPCSYIHTSLLFQCKIINMILHFLFIWVRTLVIQHQ